MPSQKCANALWKYNHIHLKKNQYFKGLKQESAAARVNM